MLLAGGVASVMARDVMACITCACGELLRDNKSCKLSNAIYGASQGCWRCLDALQRKFGDGLMGWLSCPCHRDKALVWAVLQLGHK